MHARQSAGGTPHQGSKSQCNDFGCSNRPHPPDQRQKASILLHHGSQTALTQIHWLCRPLRCALNLCSCLSKECTSCLHSDHGSPKMPSQLLLPKMHNLSCVLSSSRLSPLSYISSASRRGLLAPNPGRRGFSYSASF